MNRKVRKDLENLHVEQFELMDDKIRTGLKQLISEFQQQPALKVIDSFDLDSATALTCGGLLATYLIVLLQFKATGL